MTDDIEALKAQVAEAEARAKAAEAEAARAQAEAAKAKLAAAQKGGDAAEEPAATEEAAAEDAPAEDTAAAAPADAKPAEDAPADDAPAAEKAADEKPVDEKAPADAAPAAEKAPADAAPAADAPAADASGLDEFAQSMKQVYEWDVPAITLGSLLEDGNHIAGVNARMPLSIFNRHMLVAGATGTGKTRTLQLFAEGLSAAGVPVLLTDVKGDLTGLAEPGEKSDGLLKRTTANGQPWEPASFPIEMLAPGGADDKNKGVSVRTSVTDFGPILLARALQLNTTQQQALQLMFSWADGKGLELVDLSDLKAVAQFLTSDDGKPELKEIGGISSATAGVILRGVSALEAQGGDRFFGEPAFAPADLMRTVDGKGVINLLGVNGITERPALISTVVMWLLAELFNNLPEVGDPDKPKLVFFFDEAHLLFSDATKEFVQEVVRTVRLIRSKGVGVVFVTQTPKDIPSDVLGQLGSRVQHSLRVSTPEDLKKMKATADTFPVSPLDIQEILTNMGTGEALISVLDPKGRPTAPAPYSIWAPASVMGPAQDSTVQSVISSSPLASKYNTSVNPISAEEKLDDHIKELEEARQQAAEDAEKQKQIEKELKEAQRIKEAAEKQKARDAARRRSRVIDKTLNSILKEGGNSLGKVITRAIFGTRSR